MSASSWFVYLLRCADGTLYAGITTDPDRRLAEHNAGTGARYTRARLPVDRVYLEPASDRAAACRREAALKRLPRTAKLALVAAAMRGK
jgi:putative endonuclease